MIMAIISRAKFIGGQPAIKGIRIAVSQIVGEIEDGGLEEFIDDLNLREDNPEIEISLKEAVDYCRNQRCDLDNANGELVMYCTYCSKSGRSKCDVWEIAERVYPLNFSD